MDTQETPQQKNFWQRGWLLSKAIWNDHDFWIRALAIKGGASAAAIAGAIGISHVAALPLVVAAVGVMACSGLIGLGLYGVFIGLATSRDRLFAIKDRTFPKTPKKERTPTIQALRRKLLGSPRVKKLLQKNFVKNFMSSRVWKVTSALGHREEAIFMAGLAGTGSIFWGTVSAVALAAVIPALAVGSIFTFGTVLALGGLASGTYGIYISTQSLINSFRKKKKQKAKDAAPPAAQAAAASKPLTAELTPAFTQAQEKTEKSPDKPIVPPAPPAP
jgi:hypothetical protein